MHELAIAMEILEQSFRSASEYNATRIDSVEVELGMLRQVVPEALELAFRAAADGTIAAGAVLQLTEERAVAVCNGCECMFMPEIDSYLCPQCNQADARIVSGNEIILRSVVCQAPEGVTAP